MTKRGNDRADRIALCAKALVDRFGTRDPMRIARGLGIHILYPEGLVHLKGFYRVIMRNRFIFLNPSNSLSMNRIVCGHELGHDMLHREYAEKQVFQEFELFSHASRHEQEANTFLAELLLEDEEVLGYVSEGKTNAEIAVLTDTDPSLVALKCDGLIRRGYPLRPQSYDARFLRR